jgi:hypothetical protein
MYLLMDKGGRIIEVVLWVLIALVLIVLAISALGDPMIPARQGPG